MVKRSKLFLTDYWFQSKAPRPPHLCDNAHMLLYYPYTQGLRQAS